MKTFGFTRMVDSTDTTHWGILETDPTNLQDQRVQARKQVHRRQEGRGYNSQRHYVPGEELKGFE